MIKKQYRHPIIFSNLLFPEFIGNKSVKSGFILFSRNTAEVLPMISSDLASFPTVLENIAWIRNFSLTDGQLVCEF